MKKLTFIMLLAFVSTMTISSCTEEIVHPVEDDGGGGNGTDPKD